MQQNYPAHIYEPIRREIAVSYIRHELRKYLPSLRDENAWKMVDADVATWFDGAPFLYPVRDFWNGFYGIVMGFKLLVHLSDFITAENVTWKREMISLNELVFSGFSPKEFGVSMVTNRAEEAVDFYTKPGNVAKRADDQAKLYKNFEKTAERIADPIIVTQKKVDEKDQMVVYKGNARVYQAVLDGKTTIDAYVGRFADEKRRLVNFWVPTSYLLELVHLTRSAWGNKNEPLYQSCLSVIKEVLSFSESAKFEMKDRAVHGPSEFTKKILADLSL